MYNKLNLSKINKEILLKRKELTKDCSSTIVEVDIPDSLYQELLELGKKSDLKPEDIFFDAIQTYIIKNTEKPSGITNVIDTAEFIINMDKILDSGKDYLLLDTINNNKKTVLLTNKETIKMLDDTKILEL